MGNIAACCNAPEEEVNRNGTSNDLQKMPSGILKQQELYGK